MTIVTGLANLVTMTPEADPPSSEWHLTGIYSPGPQAHPAAVAELHAVNASTGASLRASIGDREGRPVLLDLHIRGGGPFMDQGVNGALVHSIPLGRLQREAIARSVRDRRRLARQLKKPAPKVGSEDSFLGRLARGRRLMDEETAASLEAFPATAPPRGRRGMSDEQSRQLALELLEMKGPHLVRQLANREWPGEEEDKGRLETMRSRVKSLVKRGYLISRGAGAEGYLAGPKLVQQSEQEEK